MASSISKEPGTPGGSRMTIKTGYQKFKKGNTFFDLKYGDCIDAANNSKPLVQSLTAKRRYTVAQKEKQTMLSTFVSVDDDGKVINDHFLYDLTNGKIDKTLIDKIGQFRLI